MAKKMILENEYQHFEGNENNDKYILLYDIKNKCLKYIASSSFSVLEKPVEVDKHVLHEIIERKQSSIEFPDESDNDHNRYGKEESEAVSDHARHPKPGDYIVLGIPKSLNSIQAKEDLSVYSDKKDGMQEATSKESRPDDVPRISFFGKFAVYTSQTELPVRWRTTKSEELFAFLLNKEKNKLSKREICDALWADGEYKLDDNSLHTSIYKMKKTLLCAGIDIEIKFFNGCYYFNLPKIDCDVYLFNQIYHNVFLPLKEIDNDKADVLEEAISLYSSDYLADDDYSWAISERELLRERFTSMAESLISYYIEKKDYTAAQKVILRLIDNNNLDETAHEMLLRLYILKNERAVFLKHYENIKELFQRELGVTLCKNIRDLHDKIYV